VLIAIAFPSFKLLYTLDEVIDPALTVKVTGRPLIFYFPLDLKCTPSNKGWDLELISSEFIFIIYPQSILNLEFINQNVDGLKYNFYLTFFVKIFSPVLAIIFGYFLFSNFENLLFFSNLVIVCLIVFIFTIGLINFKNARFFGSNPNNKRSLLSSQRIGPHDYDVLCILFGALLGDGYASLRNQKYGETVRFAFKQSIVHKAYFFYFFYFFFSRGYCSSNGPSFYTRTISGYDKIYSGYEFSTFSFSSLV
jgi:uncharacterized membrane protein